MWAWENFLFFVVFAIIMIGIRDQNDRRDGIHHGGWIAKMIIWALLVILMFFLPNAVINIYASNNIFATIVMELSTAQTGDRERDLGVNMGLVLFVIRRNSWFCVLFSGLGWPVCCKVVCYIVAFTFSGILFICFNPSGNDCGLNVFLLVMTMVLLAFAFAVIATSCSKDIIAFSISFYYFLLPASIVSVYCVYGCYTGIAMTILSVLYSALRAGSSTTFLSPTFFTHVIIRKNLATSALKQPLVESDNLEEGKEKKEEKEARPVTCSYTLFHLIFALASMYWGMLLTGRTSSSESTELIDVGWTSVWIKICSEWATAALYIRSLVAPLILRDREFG
ncbi:Serine incorporator/TMS membrane protein [Dillenia turbinata]|uniref:Serine incorporator/TMS membrane protein n=1 Tax=Dillenia turbinata TaxID=194707 RepID=A0AAN8Z9J1_9MAGN